MLVCMHMRAFLLILIYPFYYRSHLPVFPPYFQLVWEDNAFILQNSILPPLFLINHSTYSLCVSLFLVHFNVTISVVLCFILCSSPTPLEAVGDSQVHTLYHIYLPLLHSISKILLPPVTTSLSSSVTVIPLSIFFFPLLGYQPMIS